MKKSRLALADFDNDGQGDALVVNGQIFPQVVALKDPEDTYRQRNRLVVGTGGGRYREAGVADGWSPEAMRSSRGLAVGDLDNDGDLDLVIVQHNGPVTVLRNERGGGFLTVRLKGRSPNTQAIGALLPHQGYQSSHDPRVHFGVGDVGEIDSLEIRWPSGKTTRLELLKANQILTVSE